MFASLSDVVLTGTIEAETLDVNRPPFSYQIGSLSLRVSGVSERAPGPDIPFGSLISLRLPPTAPCPTYSIGDSVYAFATWTNQWELLNSSFSVWRKSGDAVHTLADQSAEKGSPQRTYRERYFQEAVQQR